MTDIPIYKAEVDLGLAEAIKASASIAYCSQLEKWSNADHEALKRSLASMPEYSKASVDDLYPTKSVLVTTNWNKNDDVFGKLSVWAARKTPRNKPTNLEHDENQLVGHMIDSWAIDFDGNLIPEDTPTDSLPQHFHLCNSAVIYNAWQCEEKKKRTENLIAKIEKGEMFVSMECLFAGFDYAVVSPDGRHTIVPRDSASAHLTQHLRAYGGHGTFDGHKIGRFLQNVVFTAKGYVEKPANSDSIIFSTAGLENIFVFEESSKGNPFEEDAGVSLDSNQSLVAQTIITKGSNDMSIELVQKQLDETKAALESALADKKSLEDNLSKAGTEKYEARIAELEGIVEAKTDEDEKKKKKDEEAKARTEELEAQVAELTEANKTLSEAAASAEAEKVSASRTSTLVDGGIEKIKAEETVAKFDNLNDEQFEAIASTLIEAAKVQTTEATETEETSAEGSEEETDDAGEASAEETDLENAEASEEVDANVQRDQEQASSNEKMQVNLAKFVANKMGITLGE